MKTALIALAFCALLPKTDAERAAQIRLEFPNVPAADIPAVIDWYKRLEAAEQTVETDDAREALAFMRRRGESLLRLKPEQRANLDRLSAREQALLSEKLAILKRVIDGDPDTDADLKQVDRELKLLKAELKILHRTYKVPDLDEFLARQKK